MAAGSGIMPVLRVAMHSTFSGCFLLFAALFAAGPLRAQQPPSIEMKLGLTREKGSLPAWERPSAQATQDLTGAVRKVQAGVFLVGNERNYGTAFVISRKHRLLATNAHVADILHQVGPMFAIRHDTTAAYEVERIWYHPGVRRALRGSLPTRSQKPEDGPVDPNSPDIAVIQLAEGADLPFEFEIATVEEMNDLFARPVAMIGFPGHDTEWPAVGERPMVTFRDGVISRTTNFFGRADADKAQLQRVQHSMMSFGGFSGSPIFLPSGRVVGLHNSAVSISTGARLQHGVRVDCLWELLAHHKLDSLVPLGVERSKLLLARYEKPDPEEEKYRKAVALEVEAKLLVVQGKHAEAVAKCNEAIKLAPGFADAYYARGNAFNEFAQTQPGLTDEQKLKYMSLAVEDNQKYCQMNPSDDEGLIEFCVVVCNLTNEKTGSQRNANVREIITKLLNKGGLDADLRSRAHRTRAQANAWDESTLPDLNEAIRLRPFDPNHYIARSYYWANVGDGGREAEDKQAYNRLKAAERLRREIAANNDKKERIRLATQACELTQWGYWSDLQLLAIHLWNGGEIEKAMPLQRKAIDLAPASEKPKSRRYLKQMGQDLKGKEEK